MHELLDDPHFKRTASALTETVRFLAARGWTPATSSNFSARIPHRGELIAISRSGVDKSLFCEEDVMVVDMAGKSVAPEGARPSAETLLHTLLYESSNVGAVLHTHSVGGTVCSMQYAKRGSIEFRGYEILKGLAGNQSHEATEILPIFPNDQDMAALSRQVGDYWKHHRNIHGFLIEGHGLYTWGMDLASAKRHVETFEFLFECLLKTR